MEVWLYGCAILDRLGWLDVRRHLLVACLNSAGDAATIAWPFASPYEPRTTDYEPRRFFTYPLIVSSTTPDSFSI